MAALYTLQLLVSLHFVYMSFGQPTTVSQTGCSYTFLLPKQEDSSCPAGSTTSGVNQQEIDSLTSIVSLLSQNVVRLQDEITKMQNAEGSNGCSSNNAIEIIESTVKNQQDQLSLHTQNILQLQEDISLIKSTGGSGEGSNPSIVTVGTNYVRWGRTSCPDTAELIYEGFSAKSNSDHSGGGVNFICLDNNPQWPNVTIGRFQSAGHIHGVEYQTLTGLDSSLPNNDAPCAVCHVEGRGEHLMIPGNRTCPSSWTKEYEGLLVSERIDKTKATYVCLDSEPEVIAGGSADKSGGHFNVAEARCDNSLSCPPYYDGFEIACVVCTK